MPSSSVLCHPTLGQCCWEPLREGGQVDVMDSFLLAWISGSPLWSEPSLLLTPLRAAEKNVPPKAQTEVGMRVRVRRDAQNDGAGYAYYLLQGRYRLLEGCGRSTSETVSTDPNHPNNSFLYFLVLPSICFPSRTF